MVAEKKKTLTNEELAECARLKSKWNEHKKSGRFSSQESLGAAMGISQGAVTQYFNGHTRIGDLTLFKFAHYLGFNPEDVRPGFYRQHPELILDEKQLTSEELILLGKLRILQSLGDDALDRVEALIRALDN